MVLCCKKGVCTERKSGVSEKEGVREIPAHLHQLIERVQMKTSINANSGYVHQKHAHSMGENVHSEQNVDEIRKQCGQKEEHNEQKVGEKRKQCGQKDVNNEQKVVVERCW